MTCNKKGSRMDRNAPPMSSPRSDHRCEGHDPGAGQSCQRKGQNQKTRSEGPADHEGQVDATNTSLSSAGTPREAKRLTTAERPPMESSVLRPSCTFEFMSSKS